MSIADQPPIHSDIEPIVSEMDAISLDQALKDFEVANARVMDLTSRLISVSKALADAEVDRAAMVASLADVTQRAATAEKELVSVQASRSYRAIRMAGRLVRRVLR
jgi:hypothetical protein